MLLNRQRVIIEFLRLADRPVGKIELMKWAFLLRMEYQSRGGSAYYEFVPYHYGPFSFGLTREANELVDKGKIESTAKHWVLPRGHGEQELPAAVASDMARIVERFRTKSVKQLIDAVYESHKSYTVNSNIRKLQDRVLAKPAAYTVGYEGRQLDGLLDLLVQRGIRNLIDVRRNPVSRRFGFHKSTLSRHLDMVGIGYLHLPELGIASEERNHLSATRDYGELFHRYERETLPAQDLAVNRVASMMTETSAALMCMELDACDCHRGRLAEKIRSITGLSIVHLK